MDCFALAGSLRAANARVVAGQWALLQIYEEQQAMSIIDRNSLCQTLTILATDRPSPVDYDDRGLFDADDDFHLQQAA